MAVALYMSMLAAAAGRAQSGAPVGTPGATTVAGAAAVPDDSVAAGPEKGGHELEFWTGGGPSVPGGTRNAGVWNAGFRYGWVLTGPHGPGILRGRFETAVDVAPIFWVFQPGGTAYGLALVPLAMKWNFVVRGRVAPYFDLDGSVLFTSRNTPPGVSSINFTPSAAAGAHFLLHKYALTTEIRFLHISDAGLTNPNPGINTVEVRMGIGMFTRGKP